MEYEDFTLWIGAGREGLVARVLGSPAGEGSCAPFRSPFDAGELARLERLAARPPAGAVPDRSRHLRPAERPAPDPLRAAGQRLTAALFTGPVLALWLRSFERVELQEDPGDRGLRLRLRLDLTDPEAARLHRLPWELLHRPESDRFLALDRRTPVVRYLDVPEPVKRRVKDRRLTVLPVAAAPRGCPELDLVRESRQLTATLGRRQGVELQGRAKPTLEGLREAVRAGRPHVLHFMGHGDFRVPSGEGVLLLEDGAGRARPVTGRDLVDQLGDLLPELGLVFLNACRTAEAAAHAPYAGVAAALVRAGVGAVIAMRAPIGDEAAAVFSREVYTHLAAGAPVDAAVTEGRLAVQRASGGSPEWATPALFLRAADGHLFDVSAPGARRPGRRTGLAAALSLLVLAGAAGFQAVVSGAVSGLLARRGGPPSEPAVEEGTRWTAERADRARPVGDRGDGEREPEERDGPADAGRLVERRAKPPEPAAAGGGAEGPAGSSVHELVAGQPLYLPELRAHVTAELITFRGTELVRVTVSPDGQDAQVRSGFPAGSLRFESGEASYAVDLLSIDQARGTVRLRARRTDGSEAAPVAD